MTKHSPAHGAAPLDSDHQDLIAAGCDAAQVQQAAAAGVGGGFLKKLLAAFLKALLEGGILTGGAAPGQATKP